MSLACCPTRFDEQFRATLKELLVWRRDVRRFRKDSLPPGLLDELLQLACLAPSVGFSQPWRWVTVDSPERRVAIVKNFRQCNQDALAGYSGSRAALYARLKLEGLNDAPVHLAVFVDPETETGHGLGTKTMPEMLSYSAVCAVHTLWLAARAHGIGLGWVSILDPVQAQQTLDVPPAWQLIAYLCLGYPEQESDRPELEKEHWTSRQPLEAARLRR
jgi:5,6-dimethylbenzimidazole synthase